MNIANDMWHVFPCYDSKHLRKALLERVEYLGYDVDVLKLHACPCHTVSIKLSNHQAFQTPGYAMGCKRRMQYGHVEGDIKKLFSTNDYACKSISVGDVKVSYSGEVVEFSTPPTVKELLEIAKELEKRHAS
jgi:hypothetical protein